MQQNRYYVLRLNHRIERDKRLTTHVGLIARALGARAFLYSGEEDFHLENSISDLNVAWGGKNRFYIEFWDDWLLNLKMLSKKNFIFVHLTMYGTNIQDIQSVIRDLYQQNKMNIMFIVGGAKVPDILYTISQFNVAVTNQPHSEAGALAIALDRIFPDAIKLKFD